MSTVRVKYQTFEFGNDDIHIRTLRDRQQFSDDDSKAEDLGISSAQWPLFGVVWPSSEVLACLMSEYEVAGKRILEVGCGMALASIILNHREMDITATDYHPEVEKFLNINTDLNNDNHIPFIRTGWADADSGLGKFDMIIGSDLLYESEHIVLLADFIQQHAKPDSEVIIVDPGRGNHAKFSKKMMTLGYDFHQEKPAKTNNLKELFKGQIIYYNRLVNKNL